MVSLSPFCFEYIMSKLERKAMPFLRRDFSNFPDKQITNKHLADDIITEASVFPASQLYQMQEQDYLKSLVRRDKTQTHTSVNNGIYTIPVDTPFIFDISINILETTTVYVYNLDDGEFVDIFTEDNFFELGTNIVGNFKVPAKSFSSTGYYCIVVLRETDEVQTFHLYVHDQGEQYRYRFHYYSHPQNINLTIPLGDLPSLTGNDISVDVIDTDRSTILSTYTIGSGGISENSFLSGFYTAILNGSDFASDGIYTIVITHENDEVELFEILVQDEFPERVLTYPQYLYFLSSDYIFVFYAQSGLTGTDLEIKVTDTDYSSILLSGDLNSEIVEIGATGLYKCTIGNSIFSNTGRHFAILYNNITGDRIVFTLMRIYANSKDIVIVGDFHSHYGYISSLLFAERNSTVDIPFTFNAGETMGISCYLEHPEKRLNRSSINTPIIEKPSLNLYYISLNLTLPSNFQDIYLRVQAYDSVLRLFHIRIVNYQYYPYIEPKGMIKGKTSTVGETHDKAENAEQDLSSILKQRGTTDVLVGFQEKNYDNSISPPANPTELSAIFTLMDDSSGDVTFLLPDYGANLGTRFIVRRYGTGTTNTGAIKAQGGDTVEGLSELSITNGYVLEFYASSAAGEWIGLRKTQIV